MRREDQDRQSWISASGLPSTRSDGGRYGNCVHLDGLSLLCQASRTRWRARRWSGSRPSFLRTLLSGTTNFSIIFAKAPCGCWVMRFGNMSRTDRAWNACSTSSMRIIRLRRHLSRTDLLLRSSECVATMCPSKPTSTVSPYRGIATAFRL